MDANYIPKVISISKLYPTTNLHFFHVNSHFLTYSRNIYSPTYSLKQSLAASAERFPVISAVIAIFMGGIEAIPSHGNCLWHGVPQSYSIVSMVLASVYNQHVGLSSSVVLI